MHVFGGGRPRNGKAGAPPVCHTNPRPAATQHVGSGEDCSLEGSDQLPKENIDHCLPPTPSKPAGDREGKTKKPPPLKGN